MADDRQQKSLLNRLISMETAIFLAGLFSLGSGFYTGEPMQYFWGGMIICGSVALHFVRKKDWKKHWEEQEAMHRHLEERRRQQRENIDADK